ncbi:Protein transport protein bet1 [Wallemia ichthyophaga EXF-994]|uniref:Protein transport protein bet1 n=1 Tax=Wallemia ichthyophaga (strain EXF-994 / CBS 113033) TaxID=1299270 RepID=R9AP38_WALI9|nr:Protein transport protein bet1 [Wallemia ichthyophaga EXF-994]EOR03948.1 Protein transport protein bet1 [Wallemia ichthyophaga EXF-994]
MSSRFNSDSHLRDRATLFSTQNRSDSPFYSHTRPTQEMENQNDQHIEGLSSKVRLLKDITLNIGQEARDSAIELGSMNDSFDSTGNLLSTTMTRLKHMSTKQSGRCWIYTVFFFLIFWIFIITWFLRR